MKKVIVMVVAAALAICASASWATAQCPTIKLDSGEVVPAGEPFTFLVWVTGDPKVVRKYEWTVSAGKIKSGQGTWSIDVDTTGAGEAGALTATVEIGGFDASCPKTKSKTIVVEKRVYANKIAEFVGPQKDEQPKLMRMAREIRDSPEIKPLYIIAYAGKKGRPDDAATALKRVKETLELFGVDKRLIKTLDGGIRDAPTIEFWIVPRGAELPKATPAEDKKPKTSQ